MSPKRYAIIGDGAAGITAAAYLRQADPAGSIEIYTDDPNPAYFRAALTNYLIGELRDDHVWAAPPDFYTTYNIQRHLVRVLEVDVANARLHLANGQQTPYDQLLIASGARANTLDIEGLHLPGVMTLRTLQDVRQVLDHVSTRHPRQAAIVGSGPLALEWAQGLKERGLQVTLVIRDMRLMSRELDATASDLVEARLRLHGIKLLLQEEVSAALPGKEGHVAALRLKSGGTLPCDLFGMAIGVRCNSEFLKNSPVALAPNGAVIVDDYQRTSVPNIYAAGDVAQVNGLTLQLWEPARLQGRTAAANMTGQAAVTDLDCYYFATRLYDLDFARVARSAPLAAPTTTLTDFPKDTGRISYRHLHIAAGQLVLALLLGERRERVRAKGRLYQRLIKAGTDITAIQQQLLDPHFDLAGWLQAQQPQPLANPISPVATHIKESARLRRAQPMAASTSAQTSDAEPAVAENLTLTSIGMNINRQAFQPQKSPTAALAVLELGAERWPLKAGVTLLGRSAKAAIVLNDPSVSQVHAQITQQGDKHFLRDLGSRNGTWVNEKQVSVPVVLQDGDQVTIGAKALTFRLLGGALPVPSAASKTAPLAAKRRLAMLVGCSSVALGLEFELADSPLTLGRDSGCDICLNEPTLSRWQAWLMQEQGEWYIADTGSANGTWINGQRLAPNERHQLQAGDELEFGRVLLKFKPWQGEG